MSEKKILQTLEEGVMLTGLVAGIGWVGQKAFGESLSPNPSKSVISFVKTTANITGSMFLRDWLKKEKYWPDILKMVDRQQVENFQKLLATFAAGGFMTAMVAGGGWITEKAFKNSFSEDPSKSFSNFIKWAANASAGQLAIKYAIK